MDYLYCLKLKPTERWYVGITPEWRWKTREFRSRGFDQPLWDGAEVSDKTLLLHAEQGLGDTIQFVRYAALAGRLGGRLVVECQSELVRLLGGVAGIDQLVRQGEPLPPFDLHAPSSAFCI